jgi:hypothetical protein
MSIPYGEICPQCGKVHLVKSLDFFNSLEPKIRAKSFKSVHRLWKSGYLYSVNIDSFTYEIYEPITSKKILIAIEETQKEEEKRKCLSCSKEISKEEFELYDGFCQNCYYIELQDLDDL